MKASPHCSQAGTQGGPHQSFKNSLVLCPHIMCTVSGSAALSLLFLVRNGGTDCFPWAARFVCAYPPLWPHTHTLAHTYTHTHACTHIHAHIHTHTHTHTHSCTHIHTLAHTYTHTHACSHIHTHAHT